jgi:hypothetical protein
MTRTALGFLLAVFVLLVLANAVWNAFDPPPSPLLIDAAAPGGQPAFLFTPRPIGRQNLVRPLPPVTKA